MPPLIGIFVGGRGLRMGGVAKGQLKLRSGQTLLERLLGVCGAALPASPCRLVGEASAYATAGVAALPDAPAGVGPLGGLRALLIEAARLGHLHVVVLACDLPYVSERLVLRLASEEPSASVLAARDEGLWQCLSARYSTDVVPELDAALAAGEHSLQRLFARLGPRAVQLQLEPAELAELRDWDRPEDVDG